VPREVCGFGAMGPHILHPSFASRLVMAGVDLRTVRELMGHKLITIRLKYAHLSPDHKRAAIETLEQRLADRSPATFHNTSSVKEVLAGTKYLAIQ